MSVSVDSRKENLAYALKLLTAEVKDNWVESVIFAPGGSPEFDAILPTTWSELESKMYVRNKLRYYTMTPRGWLTGMELLGKKADSQLASQVGRVAAVLKNSVKGRAEAAFPFIDAVAKESDVPAGLVCNIVDSKLFEYWYRRKGASWEGRGRGQLIHVPIDFGLELI
jgi:hypothetical protein